MGKLGLAPDLWGLINGSSVLQLQQRSRELLGAERVK